MKDFRDLKVWERAHQLVVRVYDLTRPFPKEELYGLTSQLRRAPSSVPANIAEGCGRGTDVDFARFLQIAMGSASGTDYRLLLCRELGHLTEAQHGPLLASVTEAKRMLAGLVARVRIESRGP
jgi:four helix bundle protein